MLAAVITLSEVALGNQSKQVWVTNNGKYAMAAMARNNPKRLR
jgi:hypothetical protein